MRNFSSTELANKTGDVLAVAAQEPVHIQRHGKSRYVLLSVEQFESLSTRADQRRARSYLHSNVWHDPVHFRRPASSHCWCCGAHCASIWWGE